MYKDDTVFYPQDEMTTMLLPVTRGCSYNKCAFCSMYKDKTYCEISFSDIELELLNGYLYTERVFLTGADPLSIGFEKMGQLLDMIYRYLPYCACISSYASIKSIARYSIEELSILHDKGLRLLYIGFETGMDNILDMMKKGHTVKEAIKQARKLNEANLAFNSIIMYGIAGKEGSIDNAIATAKMINQFVTKKVITMSLTVFIGTELNDMVCRGDFVPPNRKERLLEIKTFLENLKPEHPMIFDTTHPTNIIRIKGTLLKEKVRLIREVTKSI